MAQHRSSRLFSPGASGIWYSWRGGRAAGISRAPEMQASGGSFMAKKAANKDQARLRALIEEATVDCYDEDEQHVGLMTMVEENVVCPFKAKVIGEEVEVVELRI